MWQIIKNVEPWTLYLRGCQECAMAKTPRHLPSGKLLPLPIPRRPWSHLGVDFVTDLPASDGNTCILVTVDRFSKACRLVPLKGLPTAMETAEVLFNHIFWNFGIPEDIVSDRGPQFISRVWRSFSLLGVTISLSSGYHPQSNGQTERKIQEIGRYLLPQPPELLEPIHHLGRVRTELSPSALYGSHPLPVRTRLPATSVPLVWGTFGSTISHSLVPGEWEGLGLSTSTSPTCSTTSQTSCGCPESHHSHLPPRTEGMALHQGHPTKTALQKAESQIHWSLPHHLSSQSGHVWTQAPFTI